MNLQDILGRFKDAAMGIWLGYVLEDREKALLKVKRLSNIVIHSGRTQSESSLNEDFKNYLNQNKIRPKDICDSFTQDERDTKRFNSFKKIAEAILSIQSLSDLFRLHHKAADIIKENTNDGITQNINNRCIDLQNFVVDSMRSLLDDICQELLDHFNKNMKSTAFAKYMHNVRLMNTKLEKIKKHEPATPELYKKQFSNAQLRNDLAEITSQHQEAWHKLDLDNVEEYSHQNDEYYEKLTPDEKSFVDFYACYTVTKQVTLNGFETMSDLHTRYIGVSSPQQSITFDW